MEFMFQSGPQEECDGLFVRPQPEAIVRMSLTEFADFLAVSRDNARASSVDRLRQSVNNALGLE